MIDAALAQLLSVGLLWITFHCAGMCGPIVTGLDVTGACHGASLGRGALSLVQYQLGRAFTLGVLGAIAGLVGNVVGRTLERGGAVIALIAALATATMAVRAWQGRSTSWRSGASTSLAQIGRKDHHDGAWSRALLALHSLGAARPVVLGLVLGLLPCMIVAWALSLSASTGSASRGALVMVVLVAMTTPSLFVATSMPRVVVAAGVPAAAVARVAPIGLFVSSSWLACVAAAGFGLIEHRHVVIPLLGRLWTVMLW